MPRNTKIIKTKRVLPVVQRMIPIKECLDALIVRGPKDELDSELKQILADEVNVLSVSTKPAKELKINLDVKMDDDLKAMGLVREFIRQVNALRKKKGLTVKDKVILKVCAPDQIVKTLRADEVQVIKRTLASKIEYIDNDLSEKIEVGSQNVGIDLKI